MSTIHKFSHVLFWPAGGFTALGLMLAGAAFYGCGGPGRPAAPDRTAPAPDPAPLASPADRLPEGNDPAIQLPMETMRLTQDLWTARREPDQTVEGRLTVEGFVTTPTPGYAVALERAASDQPLGKVLELILTIRSLPGMWPQVLKAQPATFTLDSGGEAIESVRIVYPDGLAIKVPIEIAKNP